MKSTARTLFSAKLLFCWQLSSNRWMTKWSWIRQFITNEHFVQRSGTNHSNFISNIYSSLHRGSFFNSYIFLLKMCSFFIFPWMLSNKSNFPINLSFSQNQIWHATRAIMKMEPTKRCWEPTRKSNWLAVPTKWNSSRAIIRTAMPKLILAALRRFAGSFIQCHVRLDDAGR